MVAAGPAVRDLEVGRQVHGYAREDYVGGGTWGELTTLNVRAVAPAPASMDPIEAGCVPLAGLTAYQSLVEVLEVGTGDIVLIIVLIHGRPVVSARWPPRSPSHAVPW